MYPSFVNKILFGYHYLVRCDVYSIKRSYASRRIYLLAVCGKIPITFYQIIRRLIAIDRWLHTHNCRTRKNH